MIERSTRNIIVGLPPLARRALRWLHGLPVFCHWMNVYLLRQALAGFGYEPGLVRYIGLLAAGGIALDIGAAEGHYATYLGQQLGEDGRVYAFEPSDQLIPTLVARIARWRLQRRIKVVHAAVADFSGKGVFQMNPENAHGGVLTSGAGTEPKGETIDVVTIDEWVERENLTRLDLIKIDIEGAEMAALRGAEATLARFKPRLLLEVHNPNNVEQVPIFLRDRGYTCEGHDTNNPRYTIWHMHAWVDR